jgi:hypothetical protein
MKTLIVMATPEAYPGLQVYLDLQADPHGIKIEALPPLGFLLYIPPREHALMRARLLARLGCTVQERPF